MKKTKMVLAVLTVVLSFAASALAAGEKPGEKGTVDPARGKRCVECHRSKVTGAYLHDAMADNECGPCHQLPKGNHLKDNKLFAVKDKSAELCYQCHEKKAKAKSVHGVIEADGCLACHAKHNSPYKNLVKAEAPELCFQCHDKALVKEKDTVKATSFRDGKVNLHYVHAGKKNGIACLACHDVHASEQLHLVRAKGSNGKDAVTITYTGSDKGGNCTTSCHDAMTYERK